MEPTRDTLHGKWHELRNQMRQQSGKFTEDDLPQLSGKTEELTDVLQQRYGYNKAQATIEINNWLHDRDRRTKI